VELLASPDGGQFTVCGFFKGPGITRQVIDIRCPEGTLGQVVKIQVSQGSNSTLELCEVEIYAL
jgi:hypothetical protein